MTETEQNELFSLISAVCDEVATDDDVSRLTTLLEDSEARRIYLNYVDLNFELADQVNLLPAAAEAPPAAATPAPVKSFRWQWIAGIAAAVILLFAITRFQTPATPVDNVAAVPADSDDDTDPDRIGHIFASANGALAESDQEFPLEEGQSIVLSESPIVMQVGSTRLYAAGPGELRILAHNAVDLSSGRLLAVSGEGEAGFSVDTPHCNVLDLGTVFTVESGPLGTSTQVLEGSVEVRRGDDAHTLLPGGHLFQAADPTQEPLHERDLSPFRSLLELSAGGLLTEGALTPLPAPAGYLSDSIRVWPEEADVTLAEKTFASFAKPGKYEDFNGKHVSIPAGTHVDSYMIFYRPNRRKGKFSQNGVIRFPRKIVGVICGNKLLEATDSTFAGPPRPDSTLLRIFVDEEDQIVIGPDRQSLKLRLTNTAAYSTKIRVLLEAK